MFVRVSKDEIDLNVAPFIDDEVRFNLLHSIRKNQDVVVLKWGEGGLTTQAIAVFGPGAPMWVWIDRQLLAKSVGHRLIKELAELLQDWKVPQLVSDPVTAREFADRYSDLLHISSELVMSMEAYHCPEMICPQSISGEMLQADMSHLDLVAEYCVGFTYWCFNKMVSKESQLAFAKQLVRAGGLYLWEVNRDIVSMTNIFSRSPRHALINYVYTPPEFRGRGYASALVTQVSLMLQSEGLVPMLYTELNNLAARRLYRSIGFQECGTIVRYRFLY